MELEFTKELVLNEKQIVLLEMHSLLNISNILLEEFKTVEDSLTKAVDFKEVTQELTDLKDHLSDRSWVLDWLEGIYVFEKKINTLIKMASKLDENSVLNLRSVLDIFETRARELISRKDDPYIWIDHDSFALKKNFVNTLNAIQTNSKGRYQINEKGNPSSYTVDFKIVSIEGVHAVNMPAAMQDSIRDLVANARKYTPPGGHIKAELIDEGGDIHFRIEDNGIGIPEAELFYVADFGYRASNTKDRRQFGGGFGLTKAYYLAQHFKGQLKINSSLGKGTIIDLIIPR